MIRFPCRCCFGFALWVMFSSFILPISRCFAFIIPLFRCACAVVHSIYILYIYLFPIVVKTTIKNIMKYKNRRCCTFRMVFGYSIKLNNSTRNNNDAAITQTPLICDKTDLEILKLSWILKLLRFHREYFDIRLEFQKWVDQILLVVFG